MPETRVVLAGLWVAVMLTYLWGDVLRIVAGDTEFGKLGDATPTPALWLGIAALQLIPIVMIVVNLTVPDAAVRWANVVVAAAFLLFNLVSLPSYPRAYDRFLLAASLVFNALTVWYAWNWVA